MITKRIGNDIRIEWSVFMKSGEKADFNRVRTMDVFLRHSRSGKLYPQAFVAIENIIKLDFTADEQHRTGTYDLLLRYTVADVGIEGGYSTTTADSCNIFNLKDIMCDDPDDEAQISVVSIIEKGDKGDPFTFDDFTEEQIEDIKRPAIEAGEYATEQGDYAKAQGNYAKTQGNYAKGVGEDTEVISTIAEGKIEAMETLITDVTTAEGDREIAEGIRAQNETNRVSAEGDRVIAEHGRASAETSRVTTENDRMIAETGRVSAEGSRETAEGNRVIAEENRDEAEILRMSEENTRQSQEEDRQTNTAKAIGDVEDWLNTADETLSGKQDKLPINAESGDPDKILNEQGDFAQLEHTQLVKSHMNTDLDFQHITTEEKERFRGKAEIKDIEAQREELFRVVNIGSGGMVTLKPTTRNFTYRLTVLDNVLINIDLSKMIDQVGSARCRFIVDIPVAKTIIWAKPLLWSGDIPVLTAGQYIFEIINIGNIPLIWLVASTQKKAYSGVTLFVDGEGANYTEAEINGEEATRSDNSWVKPFKYLQNAINAAQAGDVIFVKEGTYYPTHKRKTAIYQDGDHADRGATFTIKRGVDIYGGFVGTEIKLWQRELDEKGFQANETILNGDIKRNADKDDFANNVVYDETQAYTYINGFSITNGNANIEGVNDGGGINSISYSLVKVLCKVSKCESSGYGGGWRRGIAINCIAVDCNTTFGGGWSQGINYNCEVYNSSSTNGGGWYGGNNYNCVAYNTVGYSGGAFYGGLNYNCIAIACEGYNGGAFYGGLNYNCIAIACEGYNGAGLLSATCTNINCLLLGNTNSSGTIIGFSDSAGSGVQIFRNNAYDTTHPSITGGEGSDIDTSTCIQNLTKEQAQITLPSFAGVPTTQAQREELDVYIANLEQHLRPGKTSVLKGAGINNATYPNPADYSDQERPTDCTIGAFEAKKD